MHWLLFQHHMNIVLSWGSRVLPLPAVRWLICYYLLHFYLSHLAIITQNTRMTTPSIPLRSLCPGGFFCVGVMWYLERVLVSSRHCCPVSVHSDESQQSQCMTYHWILWAFISSHWVWVDIAQKANSRVTLMMTYFISDTSSWSLSDQGNRNTCHRRELI